MATAVRTEERLAPAEESQLAVTWRRFRKHRMGLLGFFTLLLLVLSCIILPIVSPFNFDEINDASFFQPIGAAASQYAACAHCAGHPYFLGTDEVGRDNFTRLFYAGRISLVVGLVSTVFVVIIGSLVGALSGFYGGWIDTVLMRFVDLMLSLPDLPILLILSKMLSTSGALDKVFGTGLGTVATIVLV